MGAWDVHIGKDFCIWQCEALWNYSLVLPDERGIISMMFMMIGN
jgi:hypothetical protein